MEHFQLYICSPNPAAELITVLRRHTGQTLSRIRRVLTDGAAVVDVNIHHNMFDDFISKTTALLDALETTGVEHRCLVDGVEESREYVRNIFAQWKQIGEQLTDEDDHRSRG